MRRLKLGLSVAWLCLSSTLRAQPPATPTAGQTPASPQLVQAPTRPEAGICAMRARGDAYRVSGVPSAEHFTAYADVFEGGGDAWTTSQRAARYLKAVGKPSTLEGVQAGLAKLNALLRDSDAFTDPDTAESGDFLRLRLLSELDHLAAVLAGLSQDVRTLSLATLSDNGVRLDDFTGSSASASCDGTTYSSDSVFFSGAAPRQQVVLRAQSQQTAALGIPVAGEAVYFATLAQAIEFRALCEAVDKLFFHAKDGSLRRAARRLSEINRAWENYLARGYSQYPWESALNSLLSFSWDSPPSLQLIVAHPEPAVLLDARSSRGSALSGALLMHGLGLLFYTGAERSFYLGASLTGAATTNDNLGLGFGAAVHFGHAAVSARVPHISLALLWLDTTQAQDFPFVALSLDLWRLFAADNGEQLFRQRLPH